MSEQNDIAIFPVASMDVRTVATEGLILIRPYYLVSSMQPLRESIPSRHYAMTPKQTLELIECLKTAIQTLASAGYQSPGGLQH